MKYCQECGRMLRDSDETCPYCGTYQDIIQSGSMPGFDVTETPAVTSSGGYDHGQYQNDYASRGYSYGSSDMYGSGQEVPMAHGSEKIPYYSFWKFFLLSIVTLGIYGIYKNYKWTKDINKLCKGVGEDSFNYIIVLLLGMVTFGIYHYVWIYQQTERLKETGYRNGVKIEDSGVQNLLLVLLCGGIGHLVTQYILYDNTNRLSSVYNGDVTRDVASRNSSHKGQIVIAIIGAILAFVLSVIIAVAAYAVLQVNLDESTSLDMYEDFPELPGIIDDQDDVQSNVEEDTSDYKSVGDEADFGDYTVNIVKALKLYDYEDDPALAITLEWTNNSKEDASPLWAFNINAYQGDKKLDMTWAYPDDPDVSMDNYISNIKPGESGEFQVLFKVNDSETPVRIEVTEYSGKAKIKAEHIFNLVDSEA